MPFISRVADGQQSTSRDLALQREHVILRVRNAIAVVEVRIGGYWSYGRPIESIKWALRRNIVRRKVQREGIGVLGAVRSRDERRGKQGRRRTQIVVPEGRDAVHNSRGQPWSLSTLAALLRQQLFFYRDLWAWLDDPFQAPPALAGVHDDAQQLWIPDDGDQDSETMSIKITK